MDHSREFPAFSTSKLSSVNQPAMVVSIKSTWFAMLNSYDLPAMLYYKGTIFNSKLLVITRGYGLYQTKQHGDS